MKKLTSILILGVSFLFATAQQPKQRVKTPEERAQYRSQIMQENLGLNATQKSQVYALILKKEAEAKAVRNAYGNSRADYNKAIVPVRKSYKEELKKILTPAQFEQMKANAKKASAKKQGMKKAKRIPENGSLDIDELEKE